ncbi:MAG TPA: hypothetical protein PKK11_04835 [Methanothrix sp.]|nr:hypothetical protein [Methanothrix sp.]HPT19215.1 hypothetical protein [Methanothrix sp.]
MSYSLRGVARKYGGVTGGFSVVKQIFGVPKLTAAVSLRSKLASMSKKEHSFAVRECIFGWTAAFEQRWSHITVRIKLNPDSNISAKTVETLKTRWKSGIENKWSKRWGCGHAGEGTCPFTFEVKWVTSGQHHAVGIRPGPDRSNMGLWDTEDTGDVASHEFGHMLGLVDEYPETNRCPDRNPVNTGTVMHNNSNDVPARLMNRFAGNIGCDVVGI